MAAGGDASGCVARLAHTCSNDGALLLNTVALTEGGREVSHVVVRHDGVAERAFLVATCCRGKRCWW